METVQVKNDFENTKKKLKENKHENFHDGVSEDEIEYIKTVPPPQR